VKASLTVSTSVPQMAPNFESLRQQQQAREAKFAANEASLLREKQESKMKDNIAFGKSVATRLNTHA
jgi:hypothetical protein